MKLHFEPDLDFQLDAIESVCDLFRGQEVCRTEFTVTADPTAPQARLAFAENDLGIGNRLTLLDDEIFENLKKVQLRNSVPPSDSLASGDFTVEMETGTGKTYVYLRTIFELNISGTDSPNSSSSYPPSQSRKACTSRSRSPRITSGRSIPEHLSTTSYTTPQNSARCGISPQAHKSRSWW